MAWDDVKNFLGQALGDVSLFLRPASTWGTIPEIVEKRHEEAATPAARQSLIGSPFRAGLLGVGGKDVSGQFQPDIPETTAQNVLQPVHDPQGNAIPGVYMGPDGKLFKGGLTWPEIVDNAKRIDPNFDLSQFEPTGLQGGGIRLQRRPGTPPPPPAGFEPATQVYDPKTGTWHPGTAKLPGADKGPTAIPPDQLPFTDDTPPETPPATTRTPTTTAPPVVPPDMKPASELPPGPLPGKPAAFIFHHTGGAGDVAGVERTLQQRHLGVQYVMDRDGQIFTTATLPGQQQMQRGSGAGAGLSNQNTVGMEIIAKDDADVTPAQRAAAKKFIEDHYPDTPVYGHGEVNPGHKQATEGMSVVTDIRTARGQQPPKSRLGPSGGAPAPAGAAAPKPTREEWLRTHPGAHIRRGPHGIVAIEEAAPPAHRTDQERFFDERPTATMQDWEDFLTANKGNQASARAEANALVKEKYKTFPPAAQATLQSIYAVRGLVAEMKAALADPAVAGNRGVFEGRMKNAMTRWGFSQGSGEDVYQVLQREMGVIAIKPYLAGGRGSRHWIEGLQTFTPAAGDEGPVLNTKLDQILMRSDELEKDVRTAAKERVNPELGAPGPEATTTTTASPTTTTTLPAGDAQKAFDEHLNQYR